MVGSGCNELHWRIVTPYSDENEIGPCTDETRWFLDLCRVNIIFGCKRRQTGN